MVSVWDAYPDNTNMSSIINRMAAMARSSESYLAARDPGWNAKSVAARNRDIRTFDNLRTQASRQAQYGGTYQQGLRNAIMNSNPSTMLAGVSMGRRQADIAYNESPLNPYRMALQDRNREMQNRRWQDQQRRRESEDWKWQDEERGRTRKDWGFEDEKRDFQRGMWNRVRGMGGGGRASVGSPGGNYSVSGLR